MGVGSYIASFSVITDWRFLSGLGFSNIDWSLEKLLCHFVLLLILLYHDVLILFSMPKCHIIILFNGMHVIALADIFN